MFAQRVKEISRTITSRRVRFEGDPEVLAGIGLDPWNSSTYMSPPVAVSRGAPRATVFANGFEELTQRLCTRA